MKGSPCGWCPISSLSGPQFHPFVHSWNPIGHKSWKAFASYLYSSLFHDFKSWFPFWLRPTAPDPEHNTLNFFFSYFQIPVIHKHWDGSYQSHIEKHEHVFNSCFVFYLFFNQGQITCVTYRCCRAWVNPMVCWHGALYSVWAGIRRN